uniref:Uncharacterized protein n=1 Tax=Sphaerodactylus townsendi TaxID=933632 RepID=A0ACB8G4F6_9SAUR
MAEGGMTAVVQREQSTTMASMGGFGNNIIVSHRIHRSSQTGTESTGADGGSAQPSTSQELVAELEGRSLSESMQVTARGLSPRTSSGDVIEREEASGQSLSEQAQSSMDTEGPIEYSDLTNNNHLPDNTNFYSNDSTSGESRNRLSLLIAFYQPPKLKILSPEELLITIFVKMLHLLQKLLCLSPI